MPYSSSVSPSPHPVCMAEQRLTGFPSRTQGTDAPSVHGTFFSPPSLSERFVSVQVPEHMSTTLHRLAESYDLETDPATRLAEDPLNWKAFAFGTPSPASAAQAATSGSPSPSPTDVLTRSPRRHRRSSSSIARELGVDQEMIRMVAQQLGMRG